MKYLFRHVLGVCISLNHLYTSGLSKRIIHKWSKSKPTRSQQINWISSQFTILFILHVDDIKLGKIRILYDVPPS